MKTVIWRVELGIKNLPNSKNTKLEMKRREEYKINIQFTFIF